MSSAIAGFDELALPVPLLKVLGELGYETPSPIQAASIPALLEGRDLLGQAQTGTGKTAAFALPLLARLDLNTLHPQLLVLTPTRELAIQVAEAFQTYARDLVGFHVLPIYGGQGMDTQLRQLRRGVQVVVGTPGRVMDHLRRKTLRLEHLKTIVLDEADEMLRMGFIDDVEWILEQAPEERQIALFSATMPPPINKVAKRHLRNAVEIRIQSKTTTVAAIEQLYWRVSGLHKLDALTRILEVEESDATLIFVRTKTATVELAEKLEARGYACAALNGDISQAMRERTVEQLKNRRLDIVVATDVAARGLDVSRITHVINYDIPYDVEAYVHRIGRTGRAGRNGRAILFVAPREMHLLRAIEKATRGKLTPLQLPSSEMVTDRRVTRFKKEIEEVLASQDLEFFDKLVTEIQHDQEIGAEQIAAALALMAQREKPLLLSERQQERNSRKPNRIDRIDRIDRTNRGRRKETTRHGNDREPIEMVRYRIEVGRDHGITPGDIVGAIANEAELESRYIGHIKLHDHFSTVDLPEGMPRETFRHLKTVRLRRHPMRISVLKEPGDNTNRKRDFKRPSNKRSRRAHV